MQKSSEVKQEAIRVSELIAQNKQKKSVSNLVEKLIPTILFLLASITILTTLGILYTLLSQAIQFFKTIPIWEIFYWYCVKTIKSKSRIRYFTSYKRYAYFYCYRYACCRSNWPYVCYLFK